MKRTDLRELASSGAADKDVATYDAATNRWAPKAASAGSSSLTVQDENGTVATGVTQIDFQGAGVTATAGTGEVVVTIPGGGAGGGSSDLLAQKYSTFAATYSNATSTDVDVDAARLAVTFTAPASGNVLVEVCGLTNTSVVTNWTLRNGTTTVAEHTMGGSAYTTRTARFFLTGLTAGQSYTYKWGFRCLGTTGTNQIISGGAQGAGAGTSVSMTVRALA